jgi:hypothetical protein
VSEYGHCRPGVEGYDSREKHTTHLSSTQEELKSKVVERLQTETDGPCCTSHPHPLCHGDGPGISTRWVTGLPWQATSPPPNPAGCFPKPTGKPAPHIFRFFPAGLAGLATTGRRTCYHTPLCGVARGFAGLSVVDGLSGGTWSLRRGWWGPRHGRVAFVLTEQTAFPM